MVCQYGPEAFLKEKDQFCHLHASTRGWLNEKEEKKEPSG